MQRMINTHVEASKIGRQIAEQVIDSQRRCYDSSSGNSPDSAENDLNISNAEVGFNKDLIHKKYFCHLESLLKLGYCFSHIFLQVMQLKDIDLQCKMIMHKNQHLSVTGELITLPCRVCLVIQVICLYKNIYLCYFLLELSQLKSNIITI